VYVEYFIINYPVISPQYIHSNSLFMIRCLRGSTGVQYQEYNIKSLPVKDFRNTEVQEYQMSGSSKIIMSILVKAIIMNQVI